MTGNKTQAGTVSETQKRAEEELELVNGQLTPYRSFDEVPASLMWAFKEACDRWTIAQLKEANSHGA